MSFLTLHDPNDRVEIADGLLESLARVLTSIEYFPLIEHGVVKWDVGPGRLSAEQAEDFIARLRREEFARVGVFIGPKRADEPFIAARLSPSGHEATITEYLTSSNRKNFHGAFSDADSDMIPFAMELFRAYPSVKLIHTGLPLPKRSFRGNLSLVEDSSEACSIKRMAGASESRKKDTIAKEESK